MIDILGKPGAAEKHPELLPLLEDISKINLRNVSKINTSACSGELPVRPIYKRVAACDVDKALLKCASKERLGPAAQGVLYDVEKGCKAATNGWILVKIPQEFMGGQNRIIGVKAPSGDFPKYESIIPTEPLRIIFGINPIDILAKARGATKASKLCRYREVLLVIEGDIYGYRAAVMELALVTMISTGTKAVTLEVKEGPKPLIIRDAHQRDKLALVMPIEYGVEQLYTSLF